MSTSPITDEGLSIVIELWSFPKRHIWPTITQYLYNVSNSSYKLPETGEIATMLDVSLKIPKDFREEIAQRAKERRLSMNFTQAELASRSGVSLASIKRFEKHGLISLSSLLYIAMVLDCLAGFEGLFADEAIPSLFLPEPKKFSRGGRKQ